MKMETNVLATASGKVAKINAKEGSQVVAGELIAVIE
jgi:biotin carboxyl carrier protein